MHTSSHAEVQAAEHLRGTARLGGGGEVAWKFPRKLKKTLNGGCPEARHCFPRGRGPQCLSRGPGDKGVQKLGNIKFCIAFHSCCATAIRASSCLSLGPTHQLFIES